MSTFSGISTALSAMYAQRQALDVNGQNIANANTEGYTRQRVELNSVGGVVTPAVHSLSDGLGNGVTASGVTRLRDAFLESRGQIEHAKLAQLAGQEAIHTRIEEVFNEPSDIGIQSQLSDYWNAWHDVVNQPGDLAARAQLLQRGGTVADSLRSSDDALDSLWNSTADQLDSYVTEVNTAADTVAQLNKAIVRATAAGLPASELADKRDGLVLRLAELTGSTSKTLGNGAVDVHLGGAKLVDGGTARELKVAGGGSLRDVMADPVANAVALQWRDSSTDAGIASGELASSLQSLNKVLPEYAAKLDGVAARLASTVNTQHTRGYDLNGAAGGDFFTPTTGTVITAATIKVGLTDPAEVAASSVAPATGTDPDTGLPLPVKGNLDAGNADVLGGFAKADGGPDRFYRETVTALGVASQAAQRRTTIQAGVTQNNDAQRAAQSGVSLDEEMANMLLYQRAYQAATQMINTINGTFDSLFSMIRG
ncbi:flagellar hook-associated protein 1 [Planomonospora parontospora subsp. parontospora]|uniref:Flagellar hook-associated protein 1 n=2 Tax=Planomonospora parontospora TaxID=58119 RepID=A0AA37BP63_9ACTN|nr:flagellar hook-associated protein FlgK [Planomonospora parontospora]GGL01079.1 flagellar hook-associated protein 1 [Planomonospora parontospora]GII13182.1 flagellar hook-associated protein 1 [Planomonospora parontospora subsp. parontospora]